MSIQQTTKADPVAESADPATALRQRLAAVIAERDFWQGVAESKSRAVEASTELHRYRLSVVCDVPRCRNTISVTASKEPEGGRLAHGLLCALAAMHWQVCADTLEMLTALLPPELRDAKLAPTGDRDRCPEHRQAAVP